MKSIFFSGLFVLLFIPGLSFAKEHVISLKKESLDILPIGYSITEVINVSGEDKYIGFRLSYSNFQKEPVLFQNGIAEDLATFLLPKIPKTGTEIILRVNNIFHYEVLLEETMLVITEMNLSFIQKQGTTFIEIYRSAVSTHQSKKQSKNIVACLELSFEQFNERASKNLLNTKEEPISQLLTNPLTYSSLEDFMKVDRTKKGLFWTYDDYFFNTPDTTEGFYVKYKDKNNDSLIIKYAIPYLNSDEKFIKGLWGFADGETVYAKAGTRYLPLIYKADGIYVELKLPNSSAVIPAGMFGALIGGIIGAANKSGTGGEQLLKHDLSSGSFDIYIEPDEKVILSTLIFYSPDKNEEEFDLFVNDKFQCTLKSNSWFEVTFPSRTKTVNVTLKSLSGETFTDEIKPRLFYTDVYICYERKNKSAFFRKMAEDSANDFLEKRTDENQIQ